MADHLAQLLEAEARKRPGKPVLLADGDAVDWRRFEGMAGAVAASLAAGGVGRGSRVALCLDDPVGTVVALFGGLKAGATVLPVNPRLAAGERARILADFAPDRRIEAIGAGEADFPAVATDPGDAAIVLYTSGSTGDPKGVLLSQAAVAWALESWRGPVMDLSEADVSLSALPLAHSLGIFGSVLAPLLSGGSVAFLARFDPGDALAAIERRRVHRVPRRRHHVPAHPRQPGARRQRPLEPPLRALRRGAVPVGAREPVAREDRGAHRPGLRHDRAVPADLLSRGRARRPARRDRARGAGRRPQVVDDDGKALEAGGTGELWIRSPARMTGYLGRPAETGAVFEGDWFRTGDLASLSVEGYVRIVGRKKDMILRGGYTVAPGEVEAVLMTHPDIAEAAVIGIPDDDLGEEIAAFVSLKRPGAAEAEDIVAFCRGRMAGYKYPRHVRIEPALPKGPAGKVLKARLRF